MKTKLRCPHCRQEHLERIARRGFLKEKFWPILGFYPWECAMCRTVVMKHNRGTVRRKAPDARPPAARRVRTHTQRNATAQPR